MDQHLIINGFIGYLSFLCALSVHECAHAWTAWQCGDDTARLLGRVTLNPAAHMELVGTVILPLLAIFLAASGSGAAAFIIGWGKPVPVNPYNLRQPRRDDLLVSLAGPFSNIILAILLVALSKIVLLTPFPIVVQMLQNIAFISLLLCFFNLLPIPPLDGSSLLRNLTSMSTETYMRLSQYGFIILIVVINIPAVQYALSFLTQGTMLVLLLIFRVPWLS